MAGHPVATQTPDHGIDAFDTVSHGVKQLTGHAPLGRTTPSGARHREARGQFHQGTKFFLYLDAHRSSLRIEHQCVEPWPAVPVTHGVIQGNQQGRTDPAVAGLRRAFQRRRRRQAVVGSRLARRQAMPGSW